MNLTSSLANDLADLVQSMNLAAESSVSSLSATSTSDSFSPRSNSRLTSPPSRRLFGQDHSNNRKSHQHNQGLPNSSKLLDFSKEDNCPESDSGTVKKQEEDKNNSANMSTSDPNLSVTETSTSTASLLETFAAVARRRSGVLGGSVASTNSMNNSRNSAVSAAASRNDSASAIFGPGGAKIRFPAWFAWL